MPINVNNVKAGDIYINDYFIDKIFLGNTIVYQKCYRYPVVLGDYEYTLDSDGNLVLTKYIGTKPNKINPNLGVNVTDYEYTLDSDGNLVLTKYIGSSLEKDTPNI